MLGMRKIAKRATWADPKTVAFINQDFYVDDGITSVRTPSEAISLISETEKILGEANLDIHKVVSNSLTVMKHFNSEVLRTHKEFEANGELPMQRSLGMAWNINEDQFTYSLSKHDKPYTRRGVLSTLNSIFDPTGLISPTVLRGKLILRQLLQDGRNKKHLGWDDPLPGSVRDQWDSWKTDLQNLCKIKVRRCYRPDTPPEDTEETTTLMGFSDARNRPQVSLFTSAPRQETAPTTLSYCTPKPVWPR